MKIPMIYKTQKEFFRKSYETGEHGWPVEGAEPAFKKYLARVKKIYPYGRILDIGCGEGRNIIHASREGFHAFGMDYLPIALSRAKKFCGTEGAPRVRLFAGDVFHPPLKKYSFDAVMDYGCFHHVLKKHWSIYLKNVLSLLKPDSFFLLTVFSTKFKHFPGERRRRNYVFHRGHYDHFFTKTELKEIFSRDFMFLDLHEEAKGIWSFLFALMRRKPWAGMASS